MKIKKNVLIQEIIIKTKKLENKFIKIKTKLININ